MTLRVRSTMSGGMAVSKWLGLGIPGSEIPTTGDSGGSPLANDGISPTAEYRIATVSAPSAGTLTIYPDTSFDFAGPDGTYTWTFNVWENNVLVSGGPEVVTLIIGAAPQVFAPTGQLVSSTWLSSTGGALYTCVDETSPNEADYIYTTTPGAFAEFTFPNGGAVSAAGGFVRYNIPAGSGSVTVELRQGSTILQTWGPHTLTGSLQTFSQSITASTSDSNDLRVRFTAS